MATEHKNISDAERHEPKGASTATAGQVLNSLGAGLTSFVNPSTLGNITITTTTEGKSLTTQNPTGTDAPYQVTWGSGVVTADADIASNGIVTVLSAGLYAVTFNLNLGRTTNTGIATLFARLLINDVFTGFVQAAKIDTSINVSVMNATIFRRFNVNDTIKVQLIRDSGGTNDGGLITLDPVLAGWENSPSAAIRLQKIVGGF